MAGRIRTIKPELIEDAATAGLTDSAFRLFVGMLVLSDDHGIVRASVGYLRGQIWHEREPELPVESSIEDLGRKLVTFYEADGQRYAHIRGWQKHQRVDDAAKPRLPLPPGFEAAEDTRPNGNRTRIVWFLRKRADSRGDVPGTNSTESTTPPHVQNVPFPRARAPIPITDHRSPSSDVPGTKRPGTTLPQADRLLAAIESHPILVRAGGDLPTLADELRSMKGMGAITEHRWIECINFAAEQTQRASTNGTLKGSAIAYARKIAAEVVPSGRLEKRISMERSTQIAPNAIDNDYELAEMRRTEERTVARQAESAIGSKLPAIGGGAQ